MKIKNQTILNIFVIPFFIISCVKKSSSISSNNNYKYVIDYYEYSKGISSESEYFRDSIRNGIYRVYSPDHHLLFEEHYKLNKLNGLYRKYRDDYDSNFLIVEGYYIDDKPVGYWKYFNNQGFLEGVNIFDSTGVLKLNIHYSSNGKVLHCTPSCEY